MENQALKRISNFSIYLAVLSQHRTVWQCPRQTNGRIN